MDNQGLQVLECSCGWQCHETDKPHNCPKCENTVFYPLWNVFNRWGQRLDYVAGFSESDALVSANDVFGSIPGLTVRPKCIIVD